MRRSNVTSPFRNAAARLKGALAAMVIAAGVALPETPAAQEIVDIELVLAVDVSLSMSPQELNIQRDGYAAALVHEDVIRAIEDGLHGKVAVTYFEWAGDFMQRVIVPWTVIASREDAEAFAEMLTATPLRSARRTSISGALLYARDLFAESGYRGLKRVVDVSGDGPNNQGPPVESVRDELMAMGITINGLPLMTDGGLASAYDVDELDVYYTHCVIGGPGAFMVPVNDWSQFPEAVRRKLVLELAGTGWPAKPETDAPRITPVSTGEAYDCLIGEKKWMSRSWMWRN